MFKVRALGSVSYQSIRRFRTASALQAMTSAEKEHVERIWAGNKPNSPIYNFLLSDIKIESASKGLVRARLQLSKNHVNSKGTLHGTVSACLIDWVGGLAIASYDLRDKTGLSTDIHITYVGGAKEGEWVEVEGRANKVGGSLGFTTATISKVVDGNPGPLVATGTHTKYVKV